MVWRNFESRLSINNGLSNLKANGLVDSYSLSNDLLEKTYGLGARSTIPHLKNYRVASQKQLIHRMKNAMNYTNTDIGAKFLPPETLSNAWSAIRSVDSY